MRNALPIKVDSVAAHRESGQVVDVICIAKPRGGVFNVNEKVLREVVVYENRANGHCYYCEVEDFDEKFLILKEL